MTTSTSVGQKLWNYCNVLRDAGLSYGDYLEQTDLPHISQDDATSGASRRTPSCPITGRRPFPPVTTGPACWSGKATSWRRTTAVTLEKLASQPGTLGVIFAKAQNRIQEPAMLTRLIRELIDSERWLSLSADVKGDAYESLLERNAQDVKTGAGQYFTPRPADPGHRGRHAP